MNWSQRISMWGWSLVVSKRDPLASSSQPPTLPQNVYWYQVADRDLGWLEAVAWTLSNLIVLSLPLWAVRYLVSYLSYLTHSSLIWETQMITLQGHREWHEIMNMKALWNPPTMWMKGRMLIIEYLTQHWDGTRNRKCWLYQEPVLSKSYAVSELQEFHLCMDTCALYILFKRLRAVFDIIYMAKLAKGDSPLLKWYHWNSSCLA